MEKIFVKLTDEDYPNIELHVSKMSKATDILHFCQKTALSMTERMLSASDKDKGAQEDEN